MMPNDDIRLINELIAGDEIAFNAIFKQHYTSLCIFASHYTSAIECEEIVQDVMLWLWENREMLPIDLKIRPFLFSAVKNKCINKITRKRLQNKILSDLIAQYEENMFYIPDSYERSEIIDLLNNALTELPIEYREAFEMNRIQNMTYSEIAQKTGISSKTIAYRISQTLKKLRVVFKDYMNSFLFIV